MPNDSTVNVYHRSIDKFRPMHETVPNPTPFTIMIEPTNACNFRCRFCPTSDIKLLKSIGRKVGFMPMDLFKKIVDGIKFPSRIGKLNLYKDGEPLLHKQLPEMVAYAKQSGAFDEIVFNSQVSLLTEEKARALIEAGLDTIRISVIHVHDKGYKDLCQAYSNYAEVRENIHRLFRLKQEYKSPLRIHVKTIETGLTQEERDQFYADFRGHADTTFIDHLTGWSDSERYDWTLGRDPDVAPDGFSPVIRDRKVCPTPFYTLSVNWNGSVSVCCVDWAWRTIVGDTNQESLTDIWHGQRLREFRLMHLRGQKDRNPSCKTCHYMQGLLEIDNLDAHTEKLIPIIEATAGTPPASPGESVRAAVSV